MTKSDAKLFLEKLIRIVEDALLNGRRVEIRNFGILKPVTRLARRGRNPSNGQSVEIPERRSIKFMPSSSLKVALNAHAVPPQAA